MDYGMVEKVFGRSREEVERIGATFSTNAKLLMHALSGVCWAEARLELESRKEKHININTP